MMRICDLSDQGRLLILILLFLAMLYEIFLIMLYSVSRSGRSCHILPGICITTLLLVMSCLYDGFELCTTPVLPGAAVLFTALVHMPLETAYCLKYRKNHLSSYAIKEATDDLPSGLCFTDSSGRIVLCNRQMGNLSSVLIGSYPQTVDELENALSSPSEKCGVSRASEDPVLYRFPDGTTWRFRKTELSNGFMQLTAQNVTALHEVNEHLRAENEELKKVNEKLRRMYIPQDTEAEDLIVSAARECVTNCVNHAKGNRLTVEITEHMDITITKLPITESRRKERSSRAEDYPICASVWKRPEEKWTYPTVRSSH